MQFSMMMLRATGVQGEGTFGMNKLNDWGQMHLHESARNTVPIARCRELLWNCYGILMVRSDRYRCISTCCTCPWRKQWKLQPLKSKVPNLQVCHRAKSLQSLTSSTASAATSWKAHCWRSPLQLRLLECLQCAQPFCPCASKTRQQGPWSALSLTHAFERTDIDSQTAPRKKVN